MALTVTDLSTLPAAQVTQEHNFLAEVLQEANPALDMKRGAFTDLVTHFSAILAVKSQVEQERLRRSMSLAEIAADPTLADATTVDSLSSNFRVARKAGTAATGTLSIALDALVSVVLPRGTVFVANGQRFTTAQAYVARTAAAQVVAATDRLLVAQGDGTYVFPVEVTATVEGPAGQLSKDTLAIPTATPPHFVRAYAAGDFTGGAVEETNAELAARLSAGISAKAFSGRDHMGAALREVFPEVVADSVLGLGAAEQLRDKHGIFPGATGGKVDWYIQTQEAPAKTTLTLTATLMEKTSDNRGIWQFSLGRESLPGFYDVYQIAPADAGLYLGGFPVTSDVRGYDLAVLRAGDTFLPDIATAAEAAYSRFQTATIRFKDTATATTALTLGTAAEYAVTFRVMPSLVDLQDYALRYRVRNVMGDCLVRAPVPCFVRVSFRIDLATGQASPDTAALAADLAHLVNTYSFAGRLPASALVGVALGHLDAPAALSSLDLFGQIRRPDGTLCTLRSSEALEIPDEGETMVSPQTVCFFLDPADVAISVATN